MSNTKNTVASKTMNRLFASEPINVTGDYYIVGVPNDNGSVKLRIDRINDTWTKRGVAVIWAYWDDEKQDVVVDWEQYNINSKNVAIIAEKYAIQFCTKNYIKTHPINTPSQEFLKEQKQKETPQPKPKPIVTQESTDKAVEKEQNSNIINITSFTLKETEHGLTIVFTTDTGKTLVARYGGTKGQTTTITTTTTTVVQ